jgi:hypothetical protein
MLPVMPKIKPVMILVVLVILQMVYSTLLLPRLNQGGATTDEIASSQPGDEIVATDWFQNTLALTIQAPPNRVWPWIAQLGQERAGFYSYDFLEGLFPCQIHNRDQIFPQWQGRQIGDFMSACAGVGGWRIAVFQPDRALVVRDDHSTPWSLAFTLTPAGSNGTRLITRMRYPDPGNLAMRLADWVIIQPIHTYMQRGILFGTRTRAEGRRPTASLIEGLIWYGVLALFTTVGIFLLWRRRWGAFLLVYFSADLVLTLYLWLRPFSG